MRSARLRGAFRPRPLGVDWRQQDRPIPGPRVPIDRAGELARLERAARVEALLERLATVYTLDTDQAEFLLLKAEAQALIQPHAHSWIDPTEPPIARAPYSPVVGPGRREMTPGVEYVCRVCGEVCKP